MYGRERVEGVGEVGAGFHPSLRDAVLGKDPLAAAVVLASFRRPLHQLVDVRLFIAYIEALKANDRDAEALYAAQRLREFRRDDAQAYFKECTADNPAPPFQCRTEPVALTWRDLEP